LPSPDLLFRTASLAARSNASLSEIIAASRNISCAKADLQADVTNDLLAARNFQKIPQETALPL
jgi:hypothetical protein